MDRCARKTALAGPLAAGVYLALAGLLIHLLTNGRYGFFRDELYFLACGEHLDWGYVDHAPLIALVARLSRTFFGDSLHAIRFFPALAAALNVFLTGLIARELGGGRFAVLLACLCVLLAPVYLVSGTLLSMNAFEPLFWMGCAYVLLLAFRRDNPKLLLWIGLLAGVGLQNKHSMLFFGVALVAGLLLTRDRRLLANRWIWIAGAIALLIFLPNLIWQQQHAWPTIEDLANVKKMHKNVELGPLEFLWQQILMLLPATAPIWTAGLWFFFFDHKGSRYRALGWSYLTLLGLMIALKGKNYYMAPVYPMLFAAGGVLWEQILRSRTSLAWLKVALPLVLVVSGAILAPLFLPILPVETLLRYQDAIGVRLPKTEVHHAGVLPQFFGDMFGWPEMVRTVAEVYYGLPPHERVKAAILAGNYGEAGAIDFFGPRHGLPKAISAHQTYFLWGPRDHTGEVLILLQWSPEDARKACESVEESAALSHPYSMAEEHFRILVCRGLKTPLPELWPRLKNWN